MARKHWLMLGGGVAAIALAAGAAAALREPAAYANIATRYAATQTCSCLYVSERPLEACAADFPADARSMISLKAEDESVRASIWFGAFSAEARYEEGYGCTISE